MKQYNDSNDRISASIRNEIFIISGLLKTSLLSLKLLCYLACIITVIISIFILIVVIAIPPLWNADAIRNAMPAEIVLGRNKFIRWTAGCLIAGFEWNGSVPRVTQDLNEGSKFYDLRKSDLGEEFGWTLTDKLWELESCYDESLNDVLPPGIHVSNGRSLYFEFLNDTSYSFFCFRTDYGWALLAVKASTAVLMM